MKPYLDKITALCEKLPREELLALIIAMARKVPMAQRTEGQTALGVLPEGKYREKVSEFLIEAASALKDGNAILLGKRERFFPGPAMKI